MQIKDKDGMIIISGSRSDILSIFIDTDSFNKSGISSLLEIANQAAIFSIPDTDDGVFADLTGSSNLSIRTDSNSHDIIIVSGGILNITSTKEFLSVVGLIQDNTESSGDVNNSVGISTVESKD